MTTPPSPASRADPTPASAAPGESGAADARGQPRASAAPRPPSAPPADAAVATPVGVSQEQVTRRSHDPPAPTASPATSLPSLHSPDLHSPESTTSLQAVTERYELPFALGDRFMKFELRAELGRGGQALVLEGYDAFLDRTVAIKFIEPREPRSRQTLARRARAEARVLSRLEHENVVRVFDAGPLPDGSVYLVMERLHGQTLRAALRQRGRLGVTEALTLAIQISRGVAAAHDTGVIHRDLKPENVFIEAGNRVKVVDFGIAKVLGDDVHTTQRDRVHGTVLYMSPEHLQGLPVTPRSDVYALGTMLYEALYHHPALVDGTPKDWVQVAMFHVEKLPPPLDQVEPSVPSHVSRVVQRAIAKEPEVRFATMGAFSEALEQALARYLQECQRAGQVVEVEDLSREREPEPNDSGTPDSSAASSSERSHPLAAVRGDPTEVLSGSICGNPPHRLPDSEAPRSLAATGHEFALSEREHTSQTLTRTSRTAGPVLATSGRAERSKHTDTDEHTDRAGSSWRAHLRSRSVLVAGTTVLLVTTALAVLISALGRSGSARAGAAPASNAPPSPEPAAATVGASNASAMAPADLPPSPPVAAPATPAGTTASSVSAASSANAHTPKKHARATVSSKKPAVQSPPAPTTATATESTNSTMALVDDALSYYKRDKDKAAEKAASSASKAPAPPSGTSARSRPSTGSTPTPPAASRTSAPPRATR